MKDLLRFLTCGSVDDGKSTLIGRLLYDANLLYLDQLDALENSDSLDYASLLDGLQDERQQGITIDVAYRFFTTNKRSFIVADTPGHEQYTRNMAVGASFASLAVLLVESVSDLKTQTYRHARICKMMGINHFVFVINKMDLVDYDEKTFKQIQNNINELVKQLNITHSICIPISAVVGDNVVNRSDNMKWYDGPTLLEYLEDVVIHDELENKDFVLPVQRVCRPNSTYRGYEGTVQYGSISVGDEVTVLPSKEKSTIKSILNAGSKIDNAYEGNAVSIELNDDIDVSRGDVLTNSDEIKIRDYFAAKLIWMSDEELSINKSYYLKLASQNSVISITNINYLENVETGEAIKEKTANKNCLVQVEISSNKKLVISTFDNYPSLGRFLLIDRISNETVACGIINDINPSVSNLTWHNTTINPVDREKLLKQNAFTIWFTGLSASGKSSLANALEQKLYQFNKHTMLLDGDNIRMGLNKDLRFKQEDRSENIRRIAEVSKLMNDAGLIVLTAFISPYIEDRQMARDIIGDDKFLEVYISTPIEICEKRDPKGLYKKAREGQISSFTGIDSPYEIPENPYCIIDMSDISINEACDILFDKIIDKLSI